MQRERDYNHFPRRSINSVPPKGISRTIINHCR
jgi:hypothetical protein